MHIASLVFVLKDNLVLLGRKLKIDSDVGFGKYNGAGGKKTPIESLTTCAIRETFEEFAITVSEKDLREVAVITFFTADIPDFEVHVFLAHTFTGKPHATAEMAPAWFSAADMPYDQMMEADRFWLPKILAGQTFRMNVYYRVRGKELMYIERVPYEESPQM